MSYDRLNQIGHILLGCGSDHGRISISKPDAQLLGIIGTKDQVEEIYSEIEVKDAKMISVEKKRKVAAVIPNVLNDRDASVRSYDVNVGYARTALELKLDGRAISDLRQPDVVMPETPAEELTSV